MPSLQGERVEYDDDVYAVGDPLVVAVERRRRQQQQQRSTSTKTRNSTSYPSFVSGIYNAVQQMYRLHFDQCPAVLLRV